MKNNILDTSQVIESGIIKTGKNLEDNIVASLSNFKDKMLMDLLNTGNLIKDSLSPIGDGLKTVFTEMFQNFLGSLQSQQQSSSIMDYLPLILAGGGIFTIIVLKNK